MAIDVTTITVAQFQAQFFRSFPFFDPLIYNPNQTYNTGDRVYYSTQTAQQWDQSGLTWDQFSLTYDMLSLVGGLFYDCLADGTLNVAPVPPTNPATWIKAIDNIDNYVQDQDITNAMAEAQVAFNNGLFGSDADVTLAFLYLTAHFLCNDLKAAMGGINAIGGFPTSSRAAGSVSESYSVPAAYMEDPLLAMYTQSSYGMKYLMLALPNTRGNVISVWGGTRA
jgi:hypothetical protein